jgi:hypothetical protein
VTEAEIRAIIAAAFQKVSDDAGVLWDPERNIQVDTMLAHLRDISGAVAEAVLNP